MEKLKSVTLYEESSEKKVERFQTNTRSSLNIHTDINKVEADFEWLEIMENTIRYLDNILRNPNRFIVNEEEIVKVELARRITVDSIRHLAKHTSYIQKIEDNGDVKPSKILNINKDESYDTYENRLIYTLIDNMRNFLEIKKKSYVAGSSIKDLKKARYEARSKIGSEQIFMELSFTSTFQDKSMPEGDPIEVRIEKLDNNISMLCNTEVYKTLKRAHVARVIPPIKKTNVILKNTNFQYAMKLWDYLQTHVADDTKVFKQNKTYDDNGVLKEYFNESFLLDYLAMNTLSENKDLSKKTQTIEDITDRLIQRIVELNLDLPLSTLKDKIGERIAITKYKTEASLSEISNVFEKSIKNYLEKIENIEM
ncbi:MAG: DUF2357 domain-containing protein [Bacilli bacterium]|nr:DUF2357 domain-containing protein [Bacilli bacterium]MBR1817459.1 DUF2357 domain-containing protein [Bacilli bacterium]